MKLATEADIENSKEVTNNLMEIFLKAYIEYNPAIAMTAATFFVSTILKSADQTDKNLLNLIIQSLNVVLKDDGLELILVSKE